MARLTILVSGEGKLMRRLLDSAFFNEIKELEVAGVVSSNPQAPALARARNLQVPAFVVDAELFPNTASYCTALQNKLRDIDTDLVVLDGFLPALGCAGKYFSGRILGVKLAAEQTSMEISVYVSGEQGGVGRVLSRDSVALTEEDTQEGFTRRVYDRAEAMLMAEIRAFCTKDN